MDCFSLQIHESEGTDTRAAQTRGGQVDQACHAPWPRSLSPEIQMMDWIPIVFVTFKLLVFGTCMFFAIKWHYDREKEEKEKKK